MGDSVGAVRAFNRFYTNQIGVLRGRLHETPYSLTEARVIFELAQEHSTPIAGLRETLDIDAGYLSRILTRLEEERLVTRARSRDDGRRQIIRLTKRGRGVYRTLDSRSSEEIDAMLASLAEGERERLVSAMGTIRSLLDGSTLQDGVVLRAPLSGDFGWVVERHGALYAQEYGWDETFESLVARIVADYVDHRDAVREAAWIAEMGGVRIGSAFCVKKTKTMAQLRLLLVEPHARGTGVGTRLVDECIEFARGAGYKHIMLWTNDVLVDARRIYERAGFELVDEEPHHSYGHDLVGQNWRRVL
jgi:DNA-binding MarR family transcriptional regulator/GNAT superfamily N-acetyltransferase